MKSLGYFKIILTVINEKGQDQNTGHITQYVVVIKENMFERFT